MNENILICFQMLALYHLLEYRLPTCLLLDFFQWIKGIVKTYLVSDDEPCLYGRHLRELGFRWLGKKRRCWQEIFNHKQLSVLRDITNQRVFAEVRNSTYQGQKSACRIYATTDLGWRYVPEFPSMLKYCNIL